MNTYFGCNKVIKSEWPLLQKIDPSPEISISLDQKIFRLRRRKKLVRVKFIFGQKYAVVVPLLGVFLRRRTKKAKFLQNYIWTQSEMLTFVVLVPFCCFSIWYLDKVFVLFGCGFFLIAIVSQNDIWTKVFVFYLVVVSFW